MQVNATRRTRRRRATVAALLGVATAVAIVTSVLWQRAQTETLRAEAGKLLVLGERELLTYPTGTLAYTLKSLELSDTEAGRLLALRVLQRAPLARLAPISKGYAGNKAFGLDFSPNDEWVALGGRMKVEVIHRDGEKRVILGDYGPSPDRLSVRFGPGSDVLVADRSGDIRVWSIPDARELRRGQVDEGPSVMRMGKDAFLTFTTVDKREIIRSWPLVSGEPRLVGSKEAENSLDATDRVLAFVRGRAVYLRSLENGVAPPLLVLEHPTDMRSAALSPDGARIATSDAAGEIRIWRTAARATRPERVFQAPDTEWLRFDPVGRWLAATATVRGRPNVRLFDLTAPPGTDPLVLQRGDISIGVSVAFDPSGRWLATAHLDHASFWPLDSARALVLRGHEGAITSLLFTPDGKWLLSASQDGTVRAWPLQDPGSEIRILLKPPLLAPLGMALDPEGRRLAISSEERLYVVRLDGGPVLTLGGFSGELGRPAFDESGRLVAAGVWIGPRDQKVIRVWDLETGAVRVFGPLPSAGNGPAGGIGSVRFMGQGRLLAAVNGVGIVSFDLSSGASRVVAAQPSFILDFRVSRDGRFGVGTTREEFNEARGRVVRVNLEDGTAQPFPFHGTHPDAVALDPSDSLIATSSTDGTIRIGPASGREPHLLLGHEGDVHTVAFSPDGRWLASAGDEFTIRLWPVPDLSKPPLHRRPHEELLALLRSHTNLRAVPDPASSTGYKLEPGPFPGWAKPPEW